METQPLYGDAASYARIFPLDEDELAFWLTVLGGGAPGSGTRLLLDLGAGPSPLGNLLGAPRSVALDVSAELLAASPVAWRIRADAAALPLRPGSIDGVVSRLFGIAYAAAASSPTGAAPSPERNLSALASELRRTLSPGGAAALEIPLAHRPRRLQGLEETAEIAPGLHYRFRYLDLERESPHGAVLNTEITLDRRTMGERWELWAPLFVFTPEGALRWGAEAGLEKLRFYASYDVSTETRNPPEDALRGVLAGRRGMNGGQWGI